MRDILNRDIFMNDLVIYNDSYYLVIGDSTLFYSNNINKYPKIVTNLADTIPVVKVTNYDEEELMVKEYFENAYIKYTQDIVKTSSENINIGDVFELNHVYYIYLGMANQNSSWIDSNDVKKYKQEKLHIFYTIGDFCEAKNVIFKHKGLDIDFLLQYTSPNFKTCKDLNRFLNKVIMIDNFYVTDNSFKTRFFKKPCNKNGKSVLVDYELQFDMNDNLEV